MIEKIKITHLEKTKEYEDREWGAVLARRHQLLSSSDWTQLPDSELDYRDVRHWHAWRHKVRSISREHLTLQQATEELNELEVSKPKRYHPKIYTKM